MAVDKYKHIAGIIASLSKIRRSSNTTGHIPKYCPTT